MGAKKSVFKQKTTDSLQKLPAKRLLAYYRAEQIRFRKFQSHIQCDCCNTKHWEFAPMNEQDAINQKENKKKFESWTVYLTLVKKTLDDKKHITRN